MRKPPKMTKRLAVKLVMVHALFVEAFYGNRKIADMPAEIQGLVKAVRRWKKML
jgi:hypothetical protein